MYLKSLQLINFGQQLFCRMDFLKLTNTDWACTKLDVTYSGNLNGSTESKANIIFPDSLSKIVAPRDMSYSCSDLTLKNESIRLSFSNFQVGFLS